MLLDQDLFRHWSSSLASSYFSLVYNFWNEILSGCCTKTVPFDKKVVWLQVLLCDMKAKYVDSCWSYKHVLDMSCDEDDATRYAIDPFMYFAVACCQCSSKWFHYWLAHTTKQLYVSSPDPEKEGDTDAWRARIAKTNVSKYGSIIVFELSICHREPR